ncbi:MAG: hypothetical protein ACD_58C00118G0005 [uncultured bacterium]|nr:MAG: hypothetical protein ACD_58C00118G0005 [uncultured bacterium]
MIKSQIKQIITDGIKKTFPKIKEMHSFSVEIPQNNKFGDYSTNVAMVLAKELKQNPMDVAEKIVILLNGCIVEQRKTKNEKLKTTTKNSKLNKISTNNLAMKQFSNILCVKPGFINFYLSPEYLQSQVKNILKLDNKFGKSDFGKDKKIDIEFISANPTGPLTVGNSRGGVIGDVLANVYNSFNWQVTREYYFNDAGGQIDVLGHSIIGDEESQYQGEYINELRKKIKSKSYQEAGIEAAKIMIEEIKQSAKNMGIKFDIWFKEGENLRDKGKVKEIIDWMLEKNLAYKKDEAIWFRSTDFGDDKDRVIVRSNGEPTYFGVDCAYHKNKFIERKFDKCINIWGADHHGDLSRMKGFVKALGFNDKFDIIVHQFVRVMKDGKEVRMSKRAGNFVLVDDVLKEIGKDAYRFFMLSYPANTHMNFDLSLAIERSQKNPVYYVQYAYARIASILSKSQTSNIKSQINSKSEIPNSKLNHKSKIINLKLLNLGYELDLIKTLIKLPELIEEIAGDYQVYRLTHYAREIADKFHTFYENCKVIDDENPNVTQARLALCQATKIVLKNTFDLMGISAPEKM